MARDLQPKLRDLQRISQQLDSIWRMEVVRQNNTKRDVWKRWVALSLKRPARRPARLHCTSDSSRGWAVVGSGSSLGTPGRAEWGSAPALHLVNASAT